MQQRGPGYGYFPEPKKSVFVVAERHLAKAREIFGVDGPKVTTNQRLLGGHLGTEEGKREFVQVKAAVWASGVKQLARAAGPLPQAAFVGLTKSLQCEWQYVQQVPVTEGCGGAGGDFGLVKEAIKSKFLPALLQDEVSPVNRRHKWRDGWAVRYGKEPKDLPKQCDARGCSKQYSIEHALNCPRGGMVIRRHNEIADEWAALCKLYSAHVVREPVTKVGDPSKP